MNVLFALPLLLLTADEPRWKLAAEPEGVKVYSRDRDGDVKEMKAIGLIDASPQEVWKIIRDYENYPKAMPYTELAKVVATEGDGKVIWFYSVINAPLVDRRDYVIKLTDESDWKEGKGQLKVSWTAWNEKGDKQVAEKENMVRVKLNDGSWTLEPREDGKKTFATYYVYTDPGGSLPKFIVNKANGTAVPEVFNAIKKGVLADREKAAKK